MKKILFIACCILCTSPAMAEETGRLGFGAGAGMYDGDFGAVGRVDFLPGENERSEIILQGGLYNQTRWTLRFDADYHFIFLPDGPFRFYPLAGFDFAIQNKNNRAGINLGGGMTLPLVDQFSAFIEAKYTFGDWDGFALTAGVYF